MIVHNVRVSRAERGPLAWLAPPKGREAGFQYRGGAVGEAKAPAIHDGNG